MAQAITKGEVRFLEKDQPRMKSSVRQLQVLVHHLAQHGLQQHIPALGGADTVYYTALLAFFMFNFILESCVRVLSWAPPCWLCVQIEHFAC